MKASVYYPVSYDFFDYNFDQNPLTKYLTQQQRDNLKETRFNRLAVDKFVELIKDPLFPVCLPNNKHLDSLVKVALLAALQNKIAVETFATISNLYSAVKQFIKEPKRFEQVFNNEKKVVESIQVAGPPLSILNPSLIPEIEAVKIEDNLVVRNYLQQYFCVSKLGAESLIKSVANLDPLDRYFWLIDLPIGSTAAWSPLMHRIEVISPCFRPVKKYIKFDPNPFPPYEPRQLLVPPLSLVQNFFRSGNVKNYYPAQPSLGVFEEKDIIENKKKWIRLINIGMPGADNPNSGDGYYGGEYGFAVHDWYHWMRDCLIPKSYHLAILRIEKVLENSLNKNDRMKKQSEKIQDIIWKIFDNESFGYEQSGKEVSISPFGAIFQENNNWTQEAIDLILKDMIHNKGIWNEFGIGFSSLYAVEKFRYIALQSSESNL